LRASASRCSGRDRSSSGSLTSSVAISRRRDSALGTASLTLLTFPENPRHATAENGIERVRMKEGASRAGDVRLCSVLELLPTLRCSMFFP
jgi:hypothetical protein